MGQQNHLLIQQAQQAIKLGQKQEARHLLQQAVQQNPQDHTTWLWLATVTASPRTSLEYIQRAEMLAPHDPTVQKARAWAEKRIQQLEGAPTRPQAVSRLGGSEATNPTHVAPKKQPATAVRHRWARLFGWAILVSAVFFTAVMWWRWSAPDRVVMVANSAVLPLAPLPQATATPQPSETPTATPVRIQPKNVAASSHNPMPTWTTTPSPTPTWTPTPTYVPTFIAPLGQAPAQRPFGVAADERWIDVDLNDQTLRAYEGDTLVFETLISSGTWEHPTVTGLFRVYLRYESQTMDGSLLGYDYYLENVPYVMYFYEDYALHGTFWHNNFGNPMSHGCVNMYTPDAQWIFNWSNYGTVVNVHY